MCIQNRAAALVYRLILVAFCTAGICTMLFMDGRFSAGMLVYYTNLSNIGCWLFFVPLTIQTALDIRRDGIRATTVFLPRLKGAVTMMITVTFLVFAVMLAPVMFTMAGEDMGGYSLYSASNILVHYVTPLFVIFDWLLFDQKGRYRNYEPFLWLIIPHIYLAFALIRAQVGPALPGMNSRYPYFFLDVDLYGWGGVALMVLGITVFFTALGYLLVLLDRLEIKNRRLHYKKPAERLG